jgi:hypothetical protein
VLVFVSGCGKGRIPTYPVTGAIVVDGKPAAGAIIVFVPNSTAEEEGQRERPFAIADAEGQFNLTTFEPGDGAPAGDYKALVQWPAPLAPEAARGGGRAAVGPDRLKGKYFDLEKSALTATVAEESNELPPFELKSQ